MEILLCIAGLDAIALGLCWFVWVQARRKNPAYRIQFSIGEILGVTLGLSPVLYYFAQILQSSLSNEAVWPLLACMGYLIPHQLAGLFVFRAKSLEQSDRPPGFNQSFLLGLTGTTLGLIAMPFLTIVLSLSVLAALMIGMVTFPILGPILLVYWLFRVGKRKTTPEKSGNELESSKVSQ